MNKSFYLSEDRKVLLVLDGVSGLFERFELVGSAASGQATIEDMVEVVAEPKKGKSGRRCSLCGKVGHSKQKCGGAEVKHKKAMRYCARCHEMKEGVKKDGVCDKCLNKPIGAEFMLSKTFAACEAIVEKADGIKGDDLVKFAEGEGLTISQMYQMRAKVKAEWERISDEKRFGKPVNQAPSEGGEEQADANATGDSV